MTARRVQRFSDQHLPCAMHQMEQITKTLVANKPKRRNWLGDLMQVVMLLAAVVFFHWFAYAVAKAYLVPDE
eukprot:2850520-Pyramimonas_sp.AAC.2